MDITFWGTRGSLPSAGPDTVRYGGNTSCVEVRTDDGLVILDAGSGIRRLGDVIEPEIGRIDILLSHLHLDHVIGLGFFRPLFRPDLEVHIWGPSSATLDLRARLRRYLNPPLFPVRLPDLPCKLTLHDLSFTSFDLPGATVTADLVAHPGPAVGYRLDSGRSRLAYLPDHEPALASLTFPGETDWVSGFHLAKGVDLLIHDAQYSDEEYASRIGWGHSTIADAVAFAEAADVGHLVAFHHDPSHSDDQMDELFDVSTWDERPGVPLSVAHEGGRLRLA